VGRKQIDIQLILKFIALMIFTVIVSKLFVDHM